MSETKKSDTLSQIINSGSNKMLFEEIKEKRKFDLGWIETLENLLPNVERATLKIRQGIKVEQEVVQIEKVKTVDASSIRHLAANSNNVQNIDRDGLVTPSKLLTSYKVEDYGVYENRFLKTLINRLYRYVNVRYNSIQKNYESYLRRELEVDSTFKHADENIIIKFSLAGRSNAEFDVAGGSIDQIMARLDRIKLIVNGLKFSYFMKLTFNEKEVLPPIVKTNAILKNVDFIAAYKLWGFIDRETSLKFDIDHNSVKLPINSNFQNDIIKILTDIYRKYRYYLQEKRINRSALAKLKNKKPQIVPGYSGKFVISNDEIKIENTQISEYYLQHITSRLSDTYKDILAAGRSRQEAAKRVFRDLLMVADSVYDNINFDQNPDSTDESERLKYLDDKEKILASYVDVKTTNLRKHQKELVALRSQREKLLGRVEARKKREALLQAQIKLREKKQKQLEIERLAKIVAQQKAAKALEKKKEIELAKALKEKIKLEKQKQQAKFLEQLRIEKEKKAQLKERKRIEKENKLKEEKLLLAAKKEAERAQKELAMKAELEYQKDLKERERIRLKELKLQAIANEKEKKEKAKIEAKILKDREILAAKELEQNRRRQEKLRREKLIEAEKNKAAAAKKQARLDEKRELLEKAKSEKLEKIRLEKIQLKAIADAKEKEQKEAAEIVKNEERMKKKNEAAEQKKVQLEKEKAIKNIAAAENKVMIAAQKQADMEAKKNAAIKAKQELKDQKNKEEEQRKKELLLVKNNNKKKLIVEKQKQKSSSSKVVEAKISSKTSRKKRPLKKRVLKEE